MGDQETLDELVAKKAEGGFTILERSAIRRQTRKLSDVNVNLAYARMAVSFVKQKVMLVANWDEPVPTSAEGIYRVGLERARSQKDADRAEANSKAAWDKADKCVYGNLQHEKEWERLKKAGRIKDLQDVQILSDLADQHGCGNCGELTAITFMYLYNLNIRPLDFMALNDADHAFVVIGRSGSDDVKNVGRNWDKNAVVCDPWAYGLNISFDWPFSHARIPFGDSYAAYSAALLEQNMNAMHPSFSGVRVEHREE